MSPTDPALRRQSDTIATARALLAYIRANRSWFASDKMIEPYESEAVAKLARFLDDREAPDA